MIYGREHQRSLHSVRFLGQHLDNQFLIPVLPIKHFLVQIYDHFHVVGDILLLSTFIVK